LADKQLQELFAALLAQYGPRHWWPGETPFEVCVGAILTQNTNWGNVEKAIANLKAADRLSITGIDSLLPDELAALIRPAGYFNVKSRHDCRPLPPLCCRSIMAVLTGSLQDRGR
jgi:endonuclease III related protein